MEFVKLDIQDKDMLMNLFPLYQNYEAEISKEELEDIFPPNEHEANFAYFKEYFGQGYTTYICVINGEFRGFVCFHAVSDATPGYADGYEGWGHLAEIYTDKQMRRLGLGKVMIEMAERELGKLGIKGIYLMDICDNYSFWKHMGYIDTGKIEPKEEGRIYEKHFTTLQG